MEALKARNSDMPNISTFALFLAMACLPLASFAQDGESFLVQRILQKYTEAYGGLRDADALSSLSVEGTIEQSGQRFDFLMRKKRPYAFRYRLSSGENSAITGYNGSEGWKRVETNGEVTIESLEGKALSDVRDLARFEGPLFRHLEKRENKVTFIRRDMIGDRAVHVLEVSTFGSNRTHYYIDSQRAHILQIDSIEQDGEVGLQTFYRDYQEVDGFPFAREVETRKGGQTLSLARVGEIRVNPGLLSFYFEKPTR